MSRVSTVSVAAMLALSACSFNADFTINGLSVDEAGEQVIEGELSDILGLQLEGDCPELEDPEVGATFECTGTDANGQVVKFDAVLEREDFVDLTSTNAIPAALVPDVEEAAVSALEPQTGPVEVDCGTESIVLDDDDVARCLISDGVETRDVILTFSSLDPIQFNASIR